MLANLAVRPLDERLVRLAQARGYVYTRYADDLTFSTKRDSSREEALEIVRLAQGAVHMFGLEPNRWKTRVVPPGARKIVLGLLVDRQNPRLTREFRNNIETHLYGLALPRRGPLGHQIQRGFASIIGMRRHIEGLIAFAHQVDRPYAERLRTKLDAVPWPL